MSLLSFCISWEKMFPTFIPQTVRILADNSFSRKSQAVQSYWIVAFLNASYLHRSLESSIDFCNPSINLGMFKRYCTGVVEIFPIDNWAVCPAKFSLLLLEKPSRLLVAIIISECTLLLKRTIEKFCYELQICQILIPTCIRTSLYSYPILQIQCLL